MMTEKQFIEVLKKIKERCKITSCWECKFSSSCDDPCQLRKIAEELTTIPMCWNIKKIEELLNE